ncbi:MAG: DUF262 domain-containing protein [Treponema sp.]|nr:DUF262 domain-containing protein [Treponema sp.]MBR0544771.1 DUF262 domain-containing protein [Treponema sp.]
MEAHGQPLRFLCDEQILEIPFFQRAYVWNDDNWKDLLEDLLKTSGSHFLGSIILKRAKSITGTADKAIIIDGQQRLTTLSILIKALYDSIDNKRAKLINDATEALFYTLKSSDSDYLLTINHSHNDRKQFEEVMGSVVDGEIKSPILSKLNEIKEDDPRLLIKRCYKFFYTQLMSISNEERINLWDNLFDKNNKILVVIDLDDNDQEQKIFDTINSSGVRLTSTDIIKNALYQKLIELTKDSDKIAEYYKRTWAETFEKDDSVVAYWNKEKSMGRLWRQNSELLLQTVAIIKGIFDVDKKHTIQQLADLYKTEIEDYTEQQLYDFIEEITKYANIYKEHIPDFNGKENFEYNNTEIEAVEQRVLHILDKNDISTFNPYIIYIFNTYEGQDKVIIEKLREIEKYVMTYLITKKPIKNFNKDCTTFINDKTGNEIKNRLKDFTNAELKAGIVSKVSNKLGAEILFWIELKRRLAPKYDTKTLQFNYQLEHIMPQKWETNWSNVDYVDEQGNILQKNDDNKSRRYEKVYSLGNMTLLNGRLNASISNNNFQKKMEGDGKKKGVIKYSSLSVTKDDLVESIFNKGKQWNEQVIHERENYLGNEVVELWGN